MPEAGRVLGPHEIFHLAVLAGVACTWAFILGVAAGEPLSAAADHANRITR